MPLHPNRHGKKRSHGVPSRHSSGLAEIYDRLDSTHPESGSSSKAESSRLYSEPLLRTALVLFVGGIVAGYLLRKAL